MSMTMRMPRPARCGNRTAGARISQFRRPLQHPVWIVIFSLLVMGLTGFGGALFAFDEGLGGFQPEQSTNSDGQKASVVTSNAPAPSAGNQESAIPVAVDSLIRILDALSAFFEELAKIFSGGLPSSSSSADKRTTATSTASQPSTPAPRANLGVDSAELNAWKGGRLSPDKFVRLIGPAAKESMARTGVPASVTIAQAALETGWGGSTIGDARNLFGIKGTGPAGSVSKSTREFLNGRYVTVQAKFRAYNSWSESIDDHSKLLLTARYRPAMSYKDNPDMFATQLQRCGYATDPGYAKKLISIMKAHNLYQYDT